LDTHRASEGTRLANTLILDFQLPDYEMIQFSCLDYSFCGALLKQPWETHTVVEDKVMGREFPSSSTTRKERNGPQGIEDWPPHLGRQRQGVSKEGGAGRR